MSKIALLLSKYLKILLNCTCMSRAISPEPCAGSRCRGGAKSRRMPAAAGRANWGARFTCNCAGRAHWQAVPGRAHPAAPRHLRAARRLAATGRRRLFAVMFAPRLGACARSALAPAALRAPRLRRACARRCRALLRRLGPRASAAPDQGAQGVGDEGGKRDVTVYFAPCDGTCLRSCSRLAFKLVHARAAPWRLRPCVRRALAPAALRVLRLGACGSAAPAHAAAACCGAASAPAPAQRRIKGRGG